MNQPLQAPQGTFRFLIGLRPVSLRLLIGFACALTAGAQATAGPPARSNPNNWPQFRGPDSKGVSHATGLPVQWSDTKNLAWKTRLPGPGASSPVVWDNHVYVTSYSGYGLSVESAGDKAALKRHLVCLHRDTGRVIWEKTEPLVKDVAPYTSAHTIGRHGYASSTPVADDTGVFVFYAADGVIAYTHDGRERWRANCGEAVYEWGSACSPVLFDDLLIIHAGVQSKSVIALRKDTGREAWRQTGFLPAWWTPVLVAVEGRHELVCKNHYDPQVTALDPRTGERLWGCSPPIGTINSTPVAFGGTIVLLGKNGKAQAFRAGGRGDVTQSSLWQSDAGAYITSPVYHNGHLYWSRDGGVAYCVRADTGELVYEERIDGEIYASPIVADGKIYYVSRERGTYVLPADPRFEVLAHNVIETDRSVFNGSPAVSGGKLLLRSDRFLYCLESESR